MFLAKYQFLLISIFLILDGQRVSASDPTLAAPSANLAGSASNTNFNVTFRVCSALVASNYSNTSIPSNFDFKGTKVKYDEYSKQVTQFRNLGTCSKTGLASFLDSNTHVDTTDASGQGVANANSIAGSQQLTSSTVAFRECNELEKTIEKLEKEVLKIKETEKKQCYSSANSILSSEQGVPQCVPVIKMNNAHNLDRCDSIAMDIQTRSEKLLAFAKEHWMWIAGTLGAVGVGAHMLMDSGKKQADDLTTAPENKAPMPTAQVNMKNTTPKTTEETPTEAPTAAKFQRPSDQAYCQNKLRPVECFITPACDLACAAARYGVSDYAGMGLDTRMIDMNGNIIDPTTAKPKNPGAANVGANGLSGGGGSRTGGSGPGDIGNNGQLNESASNNPFSSKAKKYYDYDTDGGGGGGFGKFDEFESSFDRKPASAGKMAPLELQGKSADPLTTGPILQSKENLFDRIWSVSRAQCVRDLVYCGN